MQGISTESPDAVNAVDLDKPPQPDLEVRTMLGAMETVNKIKRRDLKNYSLERGRSELRAAASMAGTRERVHAVTDHSVDGPNGPIAIRLYAPAVESKPLAVLVWFHGGGFILGDLDSADGTCRALSNRSGAAVVSVDYRMAPENDLMAGRHDCIAVTRWVHEHGASFGLDPARIAVGGDSAGGNLAAVVAQHCAAHGPELVLQVLVYPATDLRIDYAGHPCAEGFMLTQEVMDWIKSHIAEDLGQEDPLLSPALAKSVEGVAPALVVTAGCDPLREDGLRYVERLRKAGVPVASLHYPGQFHGFVTFDLVLHAGRDALSRIGVALAAAFLQPAATGLSERFPQLEARRRKLTELQFDQLMVARFVLDLSAALLRGLTSSLSPAKRERTNSPEFFFRRFRPVVEDVS
jgi:acetyl esterase